MHISQNVLTFVLIVIDVLLIASILIQQREGGLSTVFGGEGSVFRAKRGLSRGLHYFTIVLAFLFVALSALVLVIR